MRALTLFALICFPAAVHAALKTKSVEYRDGDTVLEGHLAWDDARVKPDTSAPAVLIVHQWLGITDNERSRAAKLAESGFVAFACDIYGKGTRPKDASEARQFSGKYKGDRQLFRRRVNLGLSELLKQAGVDSKRVAAIGYCFGGTGVLELARSGANVAGVVSFHGGLDFPTPANGEWTRTTRSSSCTAPMIHSCP